MDKAQHNINKWTRYFDRCVENRSYVTTMEMLRLYTPNCKELYREYKHDADTRQPTESMQMCIRTVYPFTTIWSNVFRFFIY
jgi:hypothetical protein